jgi:hypothetical protein
VGIDRLPAFDTYEHPLGTLLDSIGNFIFCV